MSHLIITPDLWNRAGRLRFLAPDIKKPHNRLVLIVRFSYNWNPEINRYCTTEGGIITTVSGKSSK